MRRYSFLSEILRYFDSLSRYLFDQRFYAVFNPLSRHPFDRRFYAILDGLKPWFVVCRRTHQMSRSAIHQYHLFGLMPIGDTPRMVGWWYHTDLETKQRWYGSLGGFDSEIGWQQYLDKMNNKVREWQLLGCWPTKWSFSDVDGSTTPSQSVEFTVEELFVK